MKLLVGFLVVVGLLGAAMGDDEGDTGTKVCPVTVEEREGLQQKLYDNVETCTRDKIFETHGVDLFLAKDTSTTEQIHTAFNTRCQSRTLFDQCWDAAALEANACFEGIQLTKFRLHRKYKELHFEIGCVDNGEKEAKLFEAFLTRGFRLHDDCAKNASTQVVQPTPVNQDANENMIYEYNRIENVIACLNEHRSEEHDSLINIMISVGTELKEKMKCLKDGEDVLCKTLVENN